MEGTREEYPNYFCTLQEAKGTGGGNGSVRGRPSLTPVTLANGGGGALLPHKNSHPHVVLHSKPKYMEGWGVADKPFANITETRTNAKGIATTVRPIVTY